MRKGFTLLELVVVIVVVGILSAIAIPTFSSVILKSHQSAAAQTANAIVANAEAIVAFGGNGQLPLTTAALDTAALEAGLVAGSAPAAVAPAHTIYTFNGATGTISGRTVTVDETTGVVTVG